MKTITRYAADDGSEFNTAKLCKSYEALCAKVTKAIAPLGKKPGYKSSCSFENGHGYLQHTSTTIWNVRNTLIDLIIAAKIKHNWVEESRDGLAHPSYVARLLDDYSVTCLSKAWGRLLCIDKANREWGQPYYAEHPDEAQEHKCLN